MVGKMVDNTCQKLCGQGLVVYLARAEAKGVPRGEVNETTKKQQSRKWGES